MQQKRKIQATVVIAILLLMIYGKNVTERNAFKSISKTFSEVYDDRLVVNDYIFDISERLFVIQKLIDHCQKSFEFPITVKKIQSQEEEIKTLIVQFEQTQLTEEEEHFLSEFKNTINNDLSIENYPIVNSDNSEINIDEVKKYNQKIDLARKDLNYLSRIQLSEGKKLVSRAKSQINRSQIWSQFEVALLIILMVVLYFVIFNGDPSPKKEKV